MKNNSLFFLLFRTTNSFWLESPCISEMSIVFQCMFPRKKKYIYICHNWRQMTSSICWMNLKKKNELFQIKNCDFPILLNSCFFVFFFNHLFLFHFFKNAIQLIYNINSSSISSRLRHIRLSTIDGAMDDGRADGRRPPCASIAPTTIHISGDNNALCIIRHD